MIEDEYYYSSEPENEGESESEFKYNFLNYHSYSITEFTDGSKYKILYPFTDTNLERFGYEDFEVNGKYFFLLQLPEKFYLPKELWYMIFETKYAFEKKDFLSLKVDFEGHEEVIPLNDQFAVQMLELPVHDNSTNLGRMLNQLNVFYKRYPWEINEIQQVEAMEPFVKKWFLWISVCYFYLQEPASYHNPPLFISRKLIERVSMFAEIIEGIKYELENRKVNFSWKNSKYTYIVNDMIYYTSVFVNKIKYIERLPGCSVCDDFYYYYFHFNKWVEYHGLYTKEDTEKFIQSQVDIIKGDTSKGSRFYFNSYWNYYPEGNCLWDKILKEYS